MCFEGIDMMKTIENVYRYYYHEAGPIEVTIILIFFFVLPCIGFFIYYAWLRNRGGVVVPVEQYSDGPIVHSNRPIVAGSTSQASSSERRRDLDGPILPTHAIQTQSQHFQVNLPIV